MSTPASPLRVAIAQANVSQRSIAERVGIDETYLSRIVNGHLTPSQATRESIALELGRTVDELWPDTTAQAA